MRGILPGLLLFAACAVPEAVPCTTAGDCPIDQHCAQGVCRDGGGLSDDDRDRNVDCTGKGERVALRYNADVLDLDTGNVIAADFGAPFGWDVIAGFNGSREPPGVLFQNTGEGALMAHTDQPFCSIDREDATALPLNRNFLDVPFRVSVVVQTTSGRLFALGDGANNANLRLDLSFLEID